MKLVFNPLSGKFDFVGADAATRTVVGSVVLGSFCYSSIPSGTVVQVPAGQVMMQVGDLSIQGDLDLTLGDIYWVD